jgi:two-component system phosphate regulon sensor histidine kinase PhoR
MPSQSEARLDRYTVLAGVAGAAAPLLLAGLGQAQTLPALMVSAGVAGLGLALARRQRAGTPPVATHLSAPPPSAPLPFSAILDALEDPVMVIETGAPGELADHRLIFANTAARSLFRVQRQEARLITGDPQPAGHRTGRRGADRRNRRPCRLRTDRRPRPGLDGRPPGRWPGRRRGPALALLVLRDQTDLRRAERMRADFLANASHELRTPLASLTGFIETLRGPARDDTEARDRFLGIMQVQAERMARLIDDLMSLSRIELNEHIAPQGRVDLALAVTDVADAMTPVLRDKDVRIDWVAPTPGATLVEGDRDQIIQVIQNLIDNGVKYSPRGGVIRVEFLAPVAGDPPPVRDPDAAGLALLTPEHRPGELYALLRFSDSGPGMPRDALPRLTERFYRVEGQKSGDRSGTGLGLAIVKHIVNRHRGGVSVESIEGRGATFSIWLPLAADARQARPEGVTEVS